MAANYDDLYAKAASDHGVDPDILRAIVSVESGGSPNAVNRETNARGVAQFIPDTAQRYGIDPSDPAQSIFATAKMFAENLKRFGSVDGAVAAHHGGTSPENWGPKTSDYVGKVSKKFSDLKSMATQAPGLPDHLAEAFDAPATMPAHLEDAFSGGDTPAGRSSIDEAFQPAPEKAPPLPYQDQTFWDHPLVRQFVRGAAGLADGARGVAILPMAGANHIINEPARTINKIGGLVGHDPELPTLTESPSELFESQNRLIDRALPGAREYLAPRSKLEARADAVNQGIGSSLGVGGGLGLLRGAAGGLGGYEAGEMTDSPTWKPIMQLLGSLAGGFAPDMTIGAGRGIAGAAGRATAPFMDAGRRVGVGNIINQSSTNPDALQNLPAQPLPGGRLGTGQLTQDPGLAMLQKQMQASPGEGVASGAANRTNNNQVLRDAIEGLGTGVTGEEASYAMNSSLQAAHDAAKAHEKNLWGSVDPQNASQIPTAPFLNEMLARVKGMGIQRSQDVPADVTRRLDLFSKSPTMPLSEFQNFRSMLLGKQREAGMAGDNNVANILGDLQGAALDHLHSTPMHDALEASMPGAGQRWTDARNFTRNLHQTFGDDVASTINPVERIIGEKVAPSSVGTSITRAGGGQAERVGSYLTATKGVPDAAPQIGPANHIGYQPSAQDHLRDVIVTNILNKAGGMTDGNGGRLLNPAMLTRFVDENMPAVKASLSPDQQVTLTSARDYANQAALPDRVTGPNSPSAALLMGDKYLDAILGKNVSAAAPGVGSALGSGLGTLFGQPIGGAAAGYEAGKLLPKIFSGPRDKMVSLLTEAMQDPALAKQLSDAAAAAAAKKSRMPRGAQSNIAPFLAAASQISRGQ